MNLRRLEFSPDIWDDVFVKEYGFNFTYSLKSPRLKFYRYHHCGNFGFLATSHWSWTMMNEHVMYLKELFA